MDERLGQKLSLEDAIKLVLCHIEGGRDKIFEIQIFTKDHDRFTIENRIDGFRAYAPPTIHKVVGETKE